MTTKETAPFAAALLGASGEQALDALRDAGERGSALIDAWVRSGNAAALSMIAEAGSGAARKAARRGINVLGARGIKVERPARVASLSSQAAAVTMEAWLVPPDGAGNVILVIATQSPAQRSPIAFFHVREGVGVQRVEFGELSGGQLKAALRRVSKAGLEPVPIPLSYARRRLFELRARQTELGLPEPLGMRSAAELLAPVPEEPEPHPLDAEGLELGDEDTRELASKSRELHGIKEFQSWFPDRAAVDELLAEVGKKIGPGQEPEREIFDRALAEATDEMTDRYFLPERREALALLMKDSALSILFSQGEVRALQVVATIKAVQSCGLTENPPREVPFLRAFFEKAIAALAYQGGGQLKIPVQAPPPTDEPQSP